METACLEPALSRLVSGGCMQRMSLPMQSMHTHLVPRFLPTYLLHSPALHPRLRRMLRLLAVAGAPDLTVVGCANREDVDALSSGDRACLHPEYVVTHWSKPAGGLSNGTLSLGLKHQLAYLDMIERRLSAALVLEDDSTVPQDLWTRLAPLVLPRDAHIFYVGSYSPNPYRRADSTRRLVPGPAAACSLSA